ncbi:alpha/beta fold hydrolase [Pseudomonas sp. MWU13-2105]|uniref:alpha/beta fold hydrolase n=1 Tax=Pseudomonas sp. MWU13-2105 TaxID=2935074 RepID=UPI00200D6EED|nr:alpha/beta fold hydrolase [Pseudomonas sp. MWU13-2105]
MSSINNSHHPATSRVEAFIEPAADGFALGGFAWRHADSAGVRPVVIINAATSVRCRHYSRFADYLFANGMDVITYDYRGIGESRPATLRGLKASWTDWGALDFEAMLQRATREHPGQPIDVVAHSFGGCAVGLAALPFARVKAPEDIDESEVGHFAFFRSQYQEKLWPIALHWLEKGELRAGTPGKIGIAAAHGG